MATEWTISTLKELFDRTIADRDVRVELAMSAAKEAVAKAETANNARLNLLNEFRAQASDESRKYAQAALVEQKFAAESDRVSRCENLLAQLQGRSLALAGIGAAFGGIAGALIVKLTT